MSRLAWPAAIRSSTRTLCGYLTGGGVEQQRVDSGSSGSLSRWARDGLEVFYFPELDHATVFDARADRAALAGGAFSVRAAGLGFGHLSGTTLHERGVVGGK